MTTLKSFAVIAFTSVFSFISCGQSTTGTTKSTTTTKTTTTAKPATTKTVSTTVKAPAAKASTTAKKAVAKKAPQTITKSTTTKTTTTKTLTRPATTQSTTITSKPTINTQSGTTLTIPATTIKAETTAPAEPTNTRTQTTTTTPTNTTTQPQTTGGRPGTGTGTGTQTGTQTGTTPQTTGGRGGTDNTNTNTQTGGNNILNTITDGDASSAIKEALMKGVQVGVDKVSVTDGFLKNAMIKIPFPTQFKQVESTMRSVGMGSLIDNMVTSMNRAAEDAAKQAGPIFINGIKQMTVTDAVNIVSNQQPDAATQFLKRTTNESLVSAFKPSIKTALDKSLATKYWKDITTYYNKIPLVSPVSTDLPDYVTRKGVDGVFYMVAQEEAKIRKDPIKTGSDIIDKVFGAVRR